MKLPLNEIIDKIYEHVKTVEVERGVESLMKVCGSLEVNYSNALVIEALCWLVVVLNKRLEYAEKKLKEDCK
jgi:hypothetical protein